MFYAAIELFIEKYGDGVRVCFDGEKFVDCFTREPFDYQPTDEEIAKKAKEIEDEKLLAEHIGTCPRYIYRHYPQDKQNSDLADKMTFETTLKASGYKNLEGDIVTSVVEYKNGKSLESILEDTPDEFKEGVEQLIKVGVRVDWVQRCKKELKEALKEGRKPAYPEYPKI